MTALERIKAWNVYYDGLPEDWRFQMILWPIVTLFVVNMLLTIASGFPFGILPLLGVGAVVYVRVTHHYMTAAEAKANGETVEPPWWIRPFLGYGKLGRDQD
jgi:hypothetical protein